MTRRCFAGSSLDMGRSSNSFVGQARFDGCIACTNWERAVVERLLPPQLQLAPNTCTASDLHPVIFLFGEQRAGATIFGGLTIPWGVHYHEFGMAIPFVTCGGSRLLHTYVPRMYSSYFPATWNGNAHYGFSKETAEMYWQGSVFVITTLDGSLLLHAAREPVGDWVSARRCNLLNFEAMREMFLLPIIGRKAGGEYVRSYFGWDFGNAQVRSVDSTVWIDAPILSGLTPRQCHDVDDGTFEVRGMLWKLSWPTSCRF